MAAVSEASTAGNAAAAPAGLAADAGLMDPARAEAFQEIAGVAQVQISISTLSTAVLCPLAVILWARCQRKRGIDAKLENP